MSTQTPRSVTDGSHSASTTASLEPTCSLLVLTSNHFDLTWRRPWKRRLEHQSRSFASYAEIQEWYMLDNLELARQEPEYAFELESSAMAREFLLRHPERQAELRELVAAGRFMVTGAGENIIDSNLVLGESIVRNFLLGLLWAERELGCRPKLGVRTDAFGNCSQLPQIMRGCGLSWVKGFAYSPNRAPYWRGIDGSVLCNAEPPSAKRRIDLYYKHVPCERCHGHGCGSCHGRGIDPERSRIGVADIDLDVLRANPICQYMINPEELLPNPGIVEAVQGWRDTIDVRFGISDDQYPFVRHLLDQVDAPPEDMLHPGVELNPNNSGTWVTRIKTKQTCRRQEYALLGAEAAASLAALAGHPVPDSELMAAWQDLLFTMFHDAVTATMVDAAYDELKEIWQRVDARIDAIRERSLGPLDETSPGLSVWNPSGITATEIVTARLPAAAVPPAPRLFDQEDALPLLGMQTLASGEVELRFVARAVPPHAVRHYRLRSGSDQSDPEPAAGEAQNETAAIGSIRNERYLVEADQHGVTRVLDLQLGHSIAVAQDFLVGEVVLEQDLGSPWATLSPDRPRSGCARFTQLLRREIEGAQQRLVFALEIQRLTLCCLQTHLRGEITVSVTSGIPRVDFDYRLFWDSHNARVRVAMPIPFSGRAIYGVPYAALERERYEPSWGWAGANGDWPAIDWAAIEGEGLSVGVLDRGLPSRCVEPASEGPGCTLFTSILRSPTMPTYLHDPHDYSMTDYDGMRDAGHHRCALALCSGAAPVLDSDIPRLAMTWNAGLWADPRLRRLAKPPRLESAVAHLAAIKPAETGDGIVLRIAEHRGQGGPAVLHLPPSLQRAVICRSDLLERPLAELRCQGEAVDLQLRPWELLTLHLQTPLPLG